MRNLEKDVERVAPPADCMTAKSILEVKPSNKMGAHH